MIRVSPPAAMIAPPASVITAEIGSHSLRSRRSPQSAAAPAQRMKPNAPTATITPASGGA